VDDAKQFQLQSNHPISAIVIAPLLSPKGTTRPHHSILQALADTIVWHKGIAYVLDSRA
jgi:hypothetical protein